MHRRLIRHIVTTVVVACGLLAVAGCAVRQDMGVVARGPAVPASRPVTVRIPEPLDIAPRQVMGYIVVADLEAAMERIEEIAAAFAPDQAQPGILKGRVGQTLGDPDLAYLDDAMPLVIMLLESDRPTEPPPVVGFMAYTKDQPYAEAAERMGMVCEIANGVLMVSKTRDTLAMAEDLVPVYRRIGAAGITSDVRFTFYVSRLLGIYGGTIRSRIDSLAGPMAALSVMGQPGAKPDQGALMAKILKLEMNAVLALLADIEMVQSDVSFNAEAITVDKIVVPKRGSAMADVFSGPAVGENYAISLLSEPGYLMYAAQFDPGSLSNFITGIIGVLSEDPDATEILVPDLVALYEDMGEWLAGDVAVSVRAIDESPFASESAMGVRDDAKSLAMVEQGTSLMAPGSPLNKIYHDMGVDLSMALEQDVRRHAGVPVHRVKMMFDTQTVPEAWATQMKGMMKDTEFAFAGGYYLAAQAPAALDRMIDRTLAGTVTEGVALHAREVFGPGRHAYADLDFIGLMEALMATIPPGMPNPLQMLLEELTPTEPMVYAMAWSGGRARAQVRIPLSPFIQMAAAARGTGRSSSVEPTTSGAD